LFYGRSSDKVLQSSLNALFIYGYKREVCPDEKVPSLWHENKVIYSSYPPNLGPTFILTR